jgi:hypothetical protein
MNININELDKLRNELEGWLDALDELNYEAKDEELEEIFLAVRDKFHELDDKVESLKK